MLEEFIETIPGMSAGEAILRSNGRRIPVRHIARLHLAPGVEAEEISEGFGISLTLVHVALAYFFENRAEFKVDSAAQAQQADSSQAGVIGPPTEEERVRLLEIADEEYDETYDEKWFTKWIPKVCQMDPLAAQGRPRGDFVTPVVDFEGSQKLVNFRRLPGAQQSR